MAIYNKFPNLARQTENPINMSYYGGLSKPNPIGNSLGNQSISQLKPTNNQLKPPITQAFGSDYPTKPSAPQAFGSDYQNKLGGNGFVYDPTTGFGTYNGQQLGNDGRRNPVIWGRVGQHLSPNGASYGSPGWEDFVRRASAAPEYWEPYTDYAGGDAGDSFTNYRLRPEVQQRLNGRVQVEQLGSGGYSELINPAAVEWDDEFGLLTSPDNIAGPDNGPDWLQPRNLAGLAAAFAGASMFGYVPGFEGIPGLAGTSTGGLSAAEALAAAEGAETLSTAGGAFGTPLIDAAGTGLVGTSGVGAGTMAGTSLANYATMTGGLDGGGLSLLPSTGVGAAAGVGTGAAASGGGFPWQSVLGLAGGVGNLIMGNRTQNQFNDAANRADPFGTANRQRAQEMLWQLYSDPSSIENTPGYRFARDQGEQGIERQDAQRGYFRSPNMLYDLSRFNQNLAQQTYNAEVQRLMAMAGVQFDPSNAANIQANGISRSNNMQTAGLTQLLSAGGNILDWLFT
jgi:hypothetical protein